MAAATPLEYIIDEMQEHSLNCWNIKEGTAMAGEQDDEGMDIHTSIHKLKSKLSGLGAGYYTLNLSRVNKGKRKGAEANNSRKYTVLAGSSKEVQNVVSPVLGIPNKELDELREQNEKLKLQLIEHKYEQKLNELTKKIEGLESDDDNPIGRLETILIPIITEIFTSTVGRNSNSIAPVINGVVETDLMDRWLEVDSEATEVLEKIVSLAVNNPKVYKSYKPILLSL